MKIDTLHNRRPRAGRDCFTLLRVSYFDGGVSPLILHLPKKLEVDHLIMRADIVLNS